MLGPVASVRRASLRSETCFDAFSDLNFQQTTTSLEVGCLEVLHTFTAQDLAPQQQLSYYRIIQCFVAVPGKVV